MSKLELFASEDMKGHSICIDHDIPDLRVVGFLKRAKSMRVHGDPWVVFTDHNYKGEFELYRQGDYNSVPAFADKISSVRVVRGGLHDPQITVYEHIWYQCQDKELKTNADDLSTYGFDDGISSYKVQHGAWILYDQKNYQGNKMVALAGDDVTKYHCHDWYKRVRSIWFFPTGSQNE